MIAGRRDSKTSFLTRVNVWLKKTSSHAHLHGSGAECIHTFRKLRAMAFTVEALQHLLGEMHKMQSDSLANSDTRGIGRHVSFKSDDL